MLRRNFLKLIGALPFVGLVKLSVAKPKVATEGLMVEDILKAKAEFGANPVYYISYDRDTEIARIEYPDGHINQSTCDSNDCPKFTDRSIGICICPKGTRCIYKWT